MIFSLIFVKQIKVDLLLCMSGIRFLSEYASDLIQIFVIVNCLLLQVFDMISGGMLEITT